MVSRAQEPMPWRDSSWSRFEFVVSSLKNSMLVETIGYPNHIGSGIMHLYVNHVICGRQNLPRVSSMIRAFKELVMRIIDRTLGRYGSSEAGIDICRETVKMGQEMTYSG